MSQQQIIRWSSSLPFLKLIYTAVVLVLSSAVAEEVSPNALFQWPGFLPHAHSHNDYLQKRPLLDAIDSRISSVEADIWLENGKILVAHERGKWRGEFEELYLKPLDQLRHQNALPVREDKMFMLWLDIKDDTAELREHLQKLLASYTWTHTGDPNRDRIEIVLTGNKDSKEAFVTEHPSEFVTRDSNSFLDGDPSSSPSWSWYALNWKKIATWNGIGDMPKDEREHLHSLVSKIHAKGRKLRLWNHPATLAFWQEACSAGVDLLGTDQMP
ncbi:hypothetical protein ACXR0O_26795 [Verrucomicrobiota bacterium sgz303538]